MSFEEIKLSRDEIENISKLSKAFPEVEFFQVRKERDSGIGISTVVRIVEPEDENGFPTTREIDITDYRKW